MRTFAFSLATVAAVALTSVGASAQTIGCSTGGSGGLFPTSGTGNGTYQTVQPSFPFSSTLNVTSLPPGATVVTEVKLNGMTHTYTGDVQYVLTSPSGQQINLFCRQGGGNDWNGDYVVNSVEQGQPLPTAAGTPLTYPSATFSQNYGTWTSGNFAIDNVALSAVPAATGNWTLTIWDWVGGVPKQMSQEVRLPMSPLTQSQIVSVQLPVAAGTAESATLSIAKLPLVQVP